MNVDLWFTQFSNTQNTIVQSSGLEILAPGIVLMPNEMETSGMVVAERRVLTY